MWALWRSECRDLSWVERGALAVIGLCFLALAAVDRMVDEDRRG
jgi:hypothetical protein